MKGKTDGLSDSASLLIDGMLLAWRDKTGWGVDIPENQFLASARKLLDVGAIVFCQDELGRITLEPVDG